MPERARSEHDRAARAGRRQARGAAAAACGALPKRESVWYSGRAGGEVGRRAASAAAAISSSVGRPRRPLEVDDPLAEGVERVRPTIACSGTPAWRARVPISPTSLPCSVCWSSLPSPVTTARARAHARVEVERVEHARRARLEHGAERRPQPAGQPARGAGHRHAAGVARQPAASASSRSSSRSTSRRVGALLRPEDRRGAPRTGCARRTARRSARRAGRRPPRSPRSRPAPPSVVARAADARPAPPAAPASIAAAISSPVP